MRLVAVTSSSHGHASDLTVVEAHSQDICAHKNPFTHSMMHNTAPLWQWFHAFVCVWAIEVTYVYVSHLNVSVCTARWTWGHGACPAVKFLNWFSEFMLVRGMHACDSNATCFFVCLCTYVAAGRHNYIFVQHIDVMLSYDAQQGIRHLFVVAACSMFVCMHACVRSRVFMQYACMYAFVRCSSMQYVCMYVCTHSFV